MSKFHFTTVLSGAYLYKALSMYETLQQHCRDFKLFIMCVDDESYKIIGDMKYSNVELMRVAQIGKAAIEKARANRTYLEFCWTLKPITLYYVMKHYNDAVYYAHLDADLFFFSDPERIFLEAPEASLCE